MMRKTIQLITLLFGVFLLCGCNINDDIIIDKNLNIREEITFLSSNAEYYSFFENQADGDNYYQNYVNELNNDEIYGNYDIIRDNDLKDRLYIIATRKTSDLNAFKEGNLLNRYVFNNVNISGDRIITILFSDMREGLFYGDGSNAGYTVNIKVPFVVVNTNANQVDKRNNVYTWNYTAETKPSDLLISFNKDKIYRPSIFMIIGTEGLVIFGLGIIAAIIVYIYIRIRKSNSIS